MKKRYIIIASLMMGLAAVSCTDKLDSVGQLGALGSEEYYANATDDQALALIASVYNDAYGTKPGMDNWTNDMISAETYQSYSNDSFLGEVDFSFSTLYRINYQCNLIIEKMNKDTDVRKRVLGEAYFFRAWAYIHLINGWQTPPLVDHVLSTAELEPANASTSDLWNYVQTSLDEAISLLPSKSGLGGARALNGRVSKEAAQALKGKAYIYAGDPTSAATALKAVIDSRKFSLLDNFNDLYSVNGDFSDEYMWEWNVADGEDSQRGSIARMTYQNSVPRGEQLSVPGGVHLTGFNQGYLGTHPSKDFYSFMLSRGEYGKNRMNGSIWSLDDAAKMYVTLSGDEYKGTPNYEGDNLAAYIASHPGVTDQQAGMGCLWTQDFSSPELAQAEGYIAAKKYIWHSDMFTATGDKDLYSKANIPAMRYADVLLLYAEATVNSQAGLSALNEVRARAGIEPLSSYTLQDIQDERRAEFFNEGERFRDCVRWGIAKDEFKEVGKYSCTTTGVKATYSYEVKSSTVSTWAGWNDKYKVYPYATSELSQNGNLLQNTGW